MTRRTSRLALIAAAGLGLAATLTACSSVATASVGDCALVSDLQGDLTEIPTVDCSEEHDAQFVHVFDMDEGDGSFPGDGAVDEAAEEGCLQGFEDFVGIDYYESELYLRPIVPNEQTWDQANDREILCVAYLDDGSMTTESWEGAAI